MRTKHTAGDFVVEEMLGIAPLAAGSHAVYRVTKKDVTTLQVQARLAAAWGIRRSAVNFAALKDRRALTTQYASIRGNPPPTCQGEGYSASYVGRLDRPLRPTDLAANRFRLTLRDLSPGEAARLWIRLQEMADHGLPNYFHHQRFGSFHPQRGFIGATILARDAQEAVRGYLTTLYPGDRAAVRRFKSVAAGRWGDWEALLAEAPAPSNYRSLLTFLRDHPVDWRRALNLVPRQLLSLWLEAYQSHLWNRIAGGYLESRLPAPAENRATIIIAGAALPVYRTLPAELRDDLRQMTITMPHHRAAYGDARLSAAVEAVLRQEGLALSDLKARILQKAYLTRHRRPLLLSPAELQADAPADDECFPGRQKLGVQFRLPPGSYATLVIQCAGLPAQHKGTQ